MPGRASFQEAAGLVIGGGTAYEGLADRGRLQAGETVLITAENEDVPARSWGHGFGKITAHDCPSARTRIQLRQVHRLKSGPESLGDGSALCCFRALTATARASG